MVLYFLFFFSFNFFLVLPVLGMTNSSTFPETKILTLNTVLKLAIKNSPDFKRIDMSFSEKLSDSIEMGLLQNPQVEIKSLSPFSEVNIDVLQPIRLSWLGLRQIYSTTLHQTAKVEKQLAIYDELNQLIFQYYQLWLLEKQENIFQDWSKEFSQLLPRIDSAIRSGEIPELEGQIIKAEGIRFDSELEVIKADHEELSMHLLSAIGMSVQNVSLQSPELKPIPENVEIIKSFAKNKNNLFVNTKNVLSSARLKTAISRFDIIPEFAPRFYLEGIKNVGVGINFQAPLWNWNIPEQTKAAANENLAESEYRTLTNIGLDRLIETRHQKALALEKRSSIYLRELLPAYQKNYDQSRKLLLEGQMGIRDFRIIQTKYMDINKIILIDIEEALRARTKLEILIGGKIEEIL